MAVFSLLDTSKIQDEETLEFINILQSATNDLKNTLNEYVDMLNVNNSVRSKISKIDLKLLVFDVVDSIKSLIKETNTELKIDIPESVIVPFNRGKLKSVVLNLLTNSIKYSHPGKGAFINIKATELEETVEMIFSDNGIGFDSEKNADRIFELNQQFHDHEDSKGVGLYLIHNHIKNMGGKISVQSEVNKGATFTILFKK